jgi:hypothetical protein
VIHNISIDDGKGKGKKRVPFRILSEFLQSSTLHTPTLDATKMTKTL